MMTIPTPYTADSDAPEGATDSFTLVATDADGDTHTAEVSVSINQSSAPELSVGQVTVDEAHLVPGHTDGGSFSEMVTVTADMLFGAGSNVTLVSAETSTGKGTVRVNEDGSLTYTLTERTEGGSDTSNTADTEADRSTADTAQGDIIKLMKRADGKFIEIQRSTAAAESYMIPDDETSPSVQGATVFITGENTKATAITNLEDAVAGVVYTIHGNGSTNASTIANSGNFVLTKAMTLSAGKFIQLVKSSDGKFYEVARG